MELTKQGQYLDYVIAGGRMTFDAWEKDGRFDPSLSWVHFDFNDIDLRNLPIQRYDNYVEIELAEVTITITKRPPYCDRGRYGFLVENKNADNEIIDWADGFPRYFFSLQRAIDEIADWIEFRKLAPKA